MFELFSFGVTKQQDSDTRVSYSQYTMYANCPHQWKLNYMDGHKKSDPSIHLVFGTAMHETLQSWLDVMYRKSLDQANDMDLGLILYQEMIAEYKKMKSACGFDFSNPSEMKEFLEDGIEILKYVKSNRVDYFNTKNLNLVGIELPIYTKAIESHNVYIKGFLDLVFEDTYENKLVIWDIKTSTRGWNKWQKADKTKTAQLVLYKKYLAEQYGYPIDRIDVKYFIVKRKINEGMMYQPRRVQQFVPSNGTVTIKNVTESFKDFITNAFHEDGSYRLDSIFKAIKGKNSKNCRWCPFKNDFEKCIKIYNNYKLSALF